MTDVTPTDVLPHADQAPPASEIDRLVPGGLPPEDLDPLADGILMAHQVRWVEDTSTLKLCEKGRRTGITWAEALDSTLTAAASMRADGLNVFYIPDAKEKGREFIDVCARFARHVAKELLSVEEFLFEDRQGDGSSRHITAWRVRFASGHQVTALSSRPAAIRGLQGRVIIDEAAFHQDVGQVIDACNALLIWGGQIRIISTHNGATNPFNQLVKDSRAGRYDYSVHRIPFDEAVAAGLYERVCLIKGETATPEGKTAWYRKIRRSYGPRVEAMREELDAIPREGDGVLLPLPLIEACQTPEYKVVRWYPPADGFVDWPAHLRRAHMENWLAEHVDPLLAALPADRSHAVALDFGMSVDRTCMPIGYTAQDLTRHVPLIIELARCPYDQQRQMALHVLHRVPRWGRMIADANGNGQALAQELRQEFGPERIEELHANDTWYREHGTPFQAAFQGRAMLIPADLDVRDDLSQFRVVAGVPKMPRSVRLMGSDGGKRHGDAGVALLYFHAASQAEHQEYLYIPVRPETVTRQMRLTSGLRARRGSY
ncbi:hypothetical protein [Roseospira visakhapatnamensis]|uniref:Phage FluMu gp28-like protein n=1 Tax=Roseospira visakhapatnamensis TaxID=390880 RepID=A0A7W6RGK9_9PROT|nr:hypothetical protein [Roseospira visakhapatnamensis]MBB4268163.1 phage FluMu gp28-like protein [Roseospira visakhapatnamensis]